VQANLGQAFSAIGEYPDAVGAFDAALREPDYTTPWRAHQGKASALLEMGRVDEAAAAYRAAAIDPENPDPGKALVNLGLCFMALGRHEDAAEAYKAALGFDTYSGRGKALANLGQAFVAMGRFDDAVRAFERSQELHDYQMSDSARQAFDYARSQTQPPHVTVEGWETGEMPPAVQQPDDADAPEEVPPAAVDSTGQFEATPEGWSTGELQSLTGVSTPSPVDIALDAEPEATTDGDVAARAADELGFGDDEAVDAFFAMTESEMRQRDRDARRAERSARLETRSVWVPLAVSLGIVAVVVAFAVGLYYLGLGWPTQSQTVNGLMKAHEKGGEVTTFWVAVPGQDIDKEMAKIPAVKSFSVDSVSRDPADSSVTITIEPRTGAPLHYKVTLVREGVGWKVSGIDNAWRSTGGS
jgi:tetratricopeptide (TPR) repeat protein